MTARAAQIAVATAIVLSLSASLAVAQENASFHSKMRVGGKTCFSKHEHYGESPPWPSKAGAQAAAIRKWEIFTVMEYGPTWGKYSRATAKSMGCKKSSGKWVCTTTARPCKS